jgi:YHS domain-containing protein
MTRDGIAIQGYDPVAYFTDQKPVRGNSKFISRYDGATYWFANAEHKAQFDAAPDTYAPAYGGYCGYAASLSRLSPISPEWFQVLEGRLVLQHNRKAFDKWNAELKGNLLKADQNWLGLVARHGAAGKTLLYTDKHGVALEVATGQLFHRRQAADAIRGLRAPSTARTDSLAGAPGDAESDPTKYAPVAVLRHAASIAGARPTHFGPSDGQPWSSTRKARGPWERDVPGNKARPTSSGHAC